MERMQEERLVSLAHCSCHPLTMWLQSDLTRSYLVLLLVFQCCIFVCLHLAHMLLQCHRAVIFGLFMAASLLCKYIWLVNGSSSMLMPTHVLKQVLAFLIQWNCVLLHSLSALHRRKGTGMSTQAFCTGMTVATPCRCNRENRHRGLCNSRATIPAAEAVTHATDAAVEGQQTQLAAGRHCQQQFIASNRA